MARFTDVDDPALFEGARVGEGGERLMRATARRREGLVHTVEIDGHELDRRRAARASAAPTTGPSPTRLLAASLASCTAITVAMYADRKGWDIDGPRGRRSTSKARRRPASAAHFDVDVDLPDGLDDEQRERIMVIAGKCPVHRILSGGRRDRDHRSGAPGRPDGPRPRRQGVRRHRRRPRHRPGDRADALRGRRTGPARRPHRGRGPRRRRPSAGAPERRATAAPPTSPST